MNRLPLVLIPGTLCTKRAFAHAAADLAGVTEPLVRLPLEGALERAQ